MTCGLIIPVDSIVMGLRLVELTELLTAVGHLFSEGYDTLLVAENV